MALNEKDENQNLNFTKEILRKFFELIHARFLAYDTYVYPDSDNPGVNLPAYLLLEEGETKKIRSFRTLEDALSWLEKNKDEEIYFYPIPSGEIFGKNEKFFVDKASCIWIEFRVDNQALIRCKEVLKELGINHIISEFEDYIDVFIPLDELIDTKKAYAISDGLGKLITEKLAEEDISIEYIPAASLEKCKIPQLLELCSNLQDLQKLLEVVPIEFQEEEEEIQEEEGKELSNEETLKIVSLLKPAYSEKTKNFLIAKLSEWLKHANVKYSSARKVIEMLIDKESPEEKALLLDVFDRIYKVWTQVFGAPSEEGLQEVLEYALGEEKALEIIRELEEILGVASPGRDSIFALLDYDKKIYAVANLRKLVVVRARRTQNGIRYMERVFIGAPTKVIVYKDPLQKMYGLPKKIYEVVWETDTGDRYKIGPCEPNELLDILKALGLVTCSRLASDVLNAVLDGFVKKKKAIIKEETDKSGFFLIENKILCSKWKIKDVSREELKKALLLLNELAEKWYAHCKENFSMIIKWGILAPFSFVIKEKGRKKGKFLPWILAWGPTNTGKTTLGQIVLSIWNINTKDRVIGADNINTPANLVDQIEKSTFPYIIDKAESLFKGERMEEILEQCIEEIYPRARYRKGKRHRFLALAPLLLTSNKDAPKSDALRRRLIILRFSKKDQDIIISKINEFRKKVIPKLHELSALGYYIAKQIIENPDLLNKDWLDVAEELLKKAYEETGLEVPEWIKLRVDFDFKETYEDYKEDLRVFFVNKINTAYARYIGKVNIEEYIDGDENRYVKSRVDVSFEERALIVLKNNFIPWAFIKEENGEKYVYLFASLMKELEKTIGGIGGGLKSLAELMGWEYIPRKSIRIPEELKEKFGGRSVINRNVIRVKFEEFLNFLIPEIKEKAQEEMKAEGSNEDINETSPQEKQTKEEENPEEMIRKAIEEAKKEVMRNE